MASNLSTIGFTFENEADFQDVMGRCSAEATLRLTSPGGDYAIWRSRTGAELWFHLGPAPADGGERDVVGLTPFFEGHCETPLKLTSRAKRPDDSAFEGLLTGWVAPDDDTGEGVFPLVYEAVDYAAIAHQPLPAVKNIRITAFARAITGFHDEDSFFASRGERPQLAVKSFIPVGLFAAADGSDEAGAAAGAVPSPTALMTGTITSLRHLVNECTSKSFLWLSVATLETEIDVVADPELIEGDLTEGGIVEVMAVLFGRTVV